MDSVIAIHAKMDTMIFQRDNIYNYIFNRILYRTNLRYKIEFKKNRLVILFSVPLEHPISDKKYSF